jgi:hypothetical protein
MDDSQTKEVTGINHCSPALKCLNFSKSKRERSELFEFYLPQYLKLQVFQICSDKFRKVQLSCFNACAIILSLEFTLILLEL